MRNIFSINLPIFPYRPLLLTWGLWDNLRCDKGTEASLVVFVTFLLSNLRRHQQHDPVHMVESVNNTPGERPWVEVNEWVSEPLRQSLDYMVQLGLISPRDNAVHMFAVSEFTLHVVRHRISKHLLTTRFRRVPGIKGCRPDIAMLTCLETTPLGLHQVPTVEQAIAMYEAAGGNLNRETEKGLDPLRDRPDLKVKMLFHPCP